MKGEVLKKTGLRNWVIAFIVVANFFLGVYFGYTYLDGRVVLGENQRVYDYSFSEELGHRIFFDRAFCSDVGDGEQFCFSYIFLRGSDLRFDVEEKFLEELGEESE